MLWACLRFPDLAFAAAFEDAPANEPRALADGPTARRHILAADAAAQAAGIRRGQSTATAHALCPPLLIRSRKPEVEQQLLEALAAWAYQFSAHVALAPPRAVLLEVGASLRLFGGWPALERRLREGLHALGHAHLLAAAPSAAAAWVLAGCRDGTALLQAAQLQPMLADVPLALGGLPADSASALRSMGLRQLGDLFRLPRPELSRRIGPEAMAWLDRLRGHGGETLPAWRPPERFERRIEFDRETGSIQALLFPLRHLTGSLANHLRARDGGVQRFELVLEHAATATTTVPVGLLSPQREAETLFDLARGRLQQLSLPAPVRAVTLRAAQLPMFRPLSRDLFEPVHGEGLDWPALLERLRARLGDGAAQSLATHPDHRPERAWRIGPLAAASPDPRPRPLWLLPHPCPLRPAPHRLLAGPERIESGWWDGGDTRRDYYVVQTDGGQRAWAYVPAGERQGWMLHGWFT
ncbi:MAG TPA: DNA polymerase Y family protein [Rhodanobacteraceae bacterium]|nr:DNA polymerase Y family protein [Rhodanobacteraceae bacterium]